MILTEEQIKILSDFRSLISCCIEVLNYRYDIDGNTNIMPDWYVESIPIIEIRISRDIEEFNNGYDWQQEIAKVIDNSPKDEIRCYIFDILKYFSEFSETYYPYALIDRWNGYIIENKEQSNAETDEKEKTACNEMVSTFERQIREAREAASKYEDIAITFKDKSFAGSSFRELVWWVHRLANKLDAELAKRGIDFMQLQKQAGIYIKSPMCSDYTRKTDIMGLVGSFELADYYISALQIQANEKSEVSFRNIIQYEDNEEFLSRLHQLIDGRKGADVGAVLLKARTDNYITRNPTRKEFESEFRLIGSWSAISNYLSDNNSNALDRANRIIIFS